MKALLKKDFYVLSKQLRFFLVAMVVFAALPSSSTSLFAVVYASMLPYSTMAYDERCKWDRLCAMLPYSTWDIVLSKYMLGYLCCGGVALVAVAAKVIFIALGIADGGDSPLIVLVALSTATILMALTLPPMFRFGVERGRMLYVILIVGIATGSLAFLEVAGTSAAAPAMQLAGIAVPIAAVVVNAVSIFLSVRLYPHRDV